MDSNSGSRKADLIAIIILLALPYIVYWPVTTGSATFAGFDHTGINQPLKQAVFETIRNGHLPLWEHRLDRGLPLFAEGEAGIFYPVNWLFLLPGDFLTKYNLVLLLLLSIAGLLFYWWMRRLGCGPLASVLAAGAHQWGATVNFNKANMNILEGYILAPLLLMLLEPGIHREGMTRDNPWLRGAGIAVVFAMMIFAGQGQYVAYSGLFALVYTVLRIAFRGLRNIRDSIYRFGLPFIGGIIIGTGLAAVQLLPQMELIRLSERGEGALDAAFATGGLWLSPGRLFATFIFPVYHYSLDHFLPYISTTLWVGPIAVLLAGYAIRVRRHVPSGAVIIPLLITGLIFLYLAMGANAPLAGEITSWGPLGRFRGHGRLAGYFALSMLALMGIGLDALLRNGKGKFPVPLFLPELIGMLLLSIPFITHRSDYIETKFALGIFIGLIVLFYAALFISKPLKNHMPIAIVVAIMVVGQAFGFMSISSESILYKSSWDKDMANIIAVRDRSALPDEATMFAIRHKANVNVHKQVLAHGIRTFRPGPRKHIDYMGSGNAGLMENLTICNTDLPLELANWESLVHRNLWPRIDSTSGKLSSADEKLLWILGVNWIVTVNGNLEIDGFERLTNPEWENSGVPYYIYRRENPVGLFEVYKANVAAPVEEYTSPGPLPDDGGSYPIFTVKDYCWLSPTEFTADITVNEGAVFVLRDQWYPGWSVTLNDEPAALLKADRVFKAVAIQPGENHVVFSYRSSNLATGWILSGISLLICILVIVFKRHTYLLSRGKL